MASKRKQDDKHLKQLREMVSKEHNKTCFECNQRGPTYVDMTIGTFVCTSCSGILRGINPPHRVKSISMASYTAAEMAFLEKNGNEVCRHIWLGLYDSKSQPGPESKEDNKVRDYLVQKYEKKRWYVEPSQAAVLAAAKAKETTESAERKSTSSSHSTPEPRPLKSLIGSNVAPIKVSQPPGHSTSTHNISKPPTLAQTANKQKSVDLLADLGGDPFASTSQPAAQAGGFGQAPFGQATQQSPFGQPAQQAAFGQPAQQQTPFGQQAAFGQPAQQGGFADFNQAFGGPAQSNQAFPENTEQASTSSSKGDLEDLFFSPQTTQPNDPFMPAQAAAGSAPSTNNFGAFESAFTPQSAPVPVASSAPLNPTVQGLQGLSIANASPPSGGAVASSAGGDKYAAFASLDTSTTSSRETTSVNWGGGAGGSTPSGGIDWGGSSSSTAPKSSSGSGIDWGTGMAKSSPQAFPGTGSASSTSLGTTSTSSAHLFGSANFGAQAPQGNPFMAMSSSGATPSTSTMAHNPFLAGGTQAAPAQANGLFGMQPGAAPGMPAQNPMMIPGGGGGGFNQQMPPQQPGANMQMNGRVGAGFPQGQMGGPGGFGAMPQQGAMPNQFGMGFPTAQQPQGGMSFGTAGMAAMAGLQFNKMGQPQQQQPGQFGAPQQPTPQGQQQMAAWGAAPNAVPQQNPMAPNPFMMQGGGGGFGGQAALPPKSSNTSNPFL